MNRTERIIGREEHHGGRVDLSGRMFIVTGAAGSIGSAVCRQAIMWGADRVVALDRDEYRMWQLEDMPGMTKMLADCLDYEALMRAAEPGATFIHAAAYKHVGGLEGDVEAARRNNIVGTEQVCHACYSSTCDLVLVSTDKAADPAGVMGQTKRTAERYALMTDGGRAIRLGNVWGSSGSVAEVWRRQINAGQPITLTDPKMTRYYMTAGEAARATLEVATLSAGLYGANCGDPVALSDIAERYMETEGGKQRTQVIGAKPGEKAHESFVGQDEEAVWCPSERVFKVRQACKSLTGPPKHKQLKAPQGAK